MSSQLLKQSASGGSSSVYVSNDLVVAGESSFGGNLNGSQSLTYNNRFIQMGATSNTPQTTPDGTQGVNNYWQIVWGGKEIQSYVNCTATSATEILILVLPADFITNNAAYVGKKLATLYVVCQNSSSVTIQCRLGSATGQQVARQLLQPAGSATSYRVDLLVAVPYSVNSGAADNYFGIVNYTLVNVPPQCGALPPT